jgi:GNAT superfamily N-acetyltransferase
MAAHAINPAFRAITVQSGSDAGHVDHAGDSGSRPLIAFGYGFHGRHGQWWHDCVHAALLATAGPAVTAGWLDDSFEVAELHVRPAHQRRGIGRRLLLRLTSGLTERSAVLSTMDWNSPARALYRGLGFTDLLTGYRFSGADVPYAIMGAVLPLDGTRPDGARPASEPPESPSS